MGALKIRRLNILEISSGLYISFIRDQRKQPHDLIWFSTTTAVCLGSPLPLMGLAISVLWITHNRTVSPKFGATVNTVTFKVGLGRPILTHRLAPRNGLIHLWYCTNVMFVGTTKERWYCHCYYHNKKNEKNVSFTTNHKQHKMAQCHIS